MEALMADYKSMIQAKWLVEQASTRPESRDNPAVEDLLIAVNLLLDVIARHTPPASS